MAAEQEASSTLRLETFSDAVFGVAITLLALDLKAPHIDPVGNHGLLQAVLHRWPEYLGIVNSFVSVLLLWNNHRVVFRYVVRLTMPLLLANGLVLLLVTGSPYVTSIMSSYLLTAAAPFAVALYAGYSAVLSLAMQLLWWVVRRGAVLHPATPTATVRILSRTMWVGLPFYAVLVLVALWSPVVAVLLSNASWLYWAVALARAEQAGQSSTPS